MKRKPIEIQSNEVQMTNEQGDPTPELLTSFPDTPKGQREKRATLQRFAAAQNKQEKTPATKKASVRKKSGSVGGLKPASAPVSKKRGRS